MMRVASCGSTVAYSLRLSLTPSHTFPTAMSTLSPRVFLYSTTPSLPLYSPPHLVAQSHSLLSCPLPSFPLFPSLSAPHLVLSPSLFPFLLLLRSSHPSLSPPCRYLLPPLPLHCHHPASLPLSRPSCLLLVHTRVFLAAAPRRGGLCTRARFVTATSHGSK